MIPSGRYLHCMNCGQEFAEGCVRGYYCSSACQKIHEEKMKVKREEIYRAAAADQYRRCPDYQI